MTNTQAWLIVAALFALTYAAGVLTVPTIKQITGQWPPMWWTRLRSRR